MTHDEKRRHAYAIKGKAFRGIGQHIVNEPWTDGDVTINVTLLEVDDEHRVIVNCEAWRIGVKLVLDLPFIYVNPPLDHKDEESPLQSLQHIITATVRG